MNEMPSAKTIEKTCPKTAQPVRAATPEIDGGRLRNVHRGTTHLPYRTATPRYFRQHLGVKGEIVGVMVERKLSYEICGERPVARMELGELRAEQNVHGQRQELYGIGVSRLVAVAIESIHDEKGCIWNKEISPFALEIIISNAKDEQICKFANELYEKCQNLGISALLDDRNERFGVKMNDYELMGFPYAVLVGKGLANGEVEFITRANLEKQSVSVDKILNLIKDKILGE